MCNTWCVLLALLCTAHVVFGDEPHDSHASLAAWTGTWRNQLNSTMELVASQNQLSGWYTSRVGDAPGKYPLLGRYKSDTPPSTLGWTVVWNIPGHDSQSSTSWSGQVLAAQPNRLHTAWILTTEQALPKDVWAGHRVGVDVFERVL